MPGASASIAAILVYERMFYTDRVRAECREEPCKVALNRVRGMAFGWSLNPYMGCVHRCTRACIEAFVDAHNPFNVITRGPLIVRDIDVLQEAARRADVSVNFSVPTLDERVWRTTEPGTAPPRQRLRALKRLVDAGIKAGVGMAPILPGISDKPELLREVVQAAREAGATHVWANLLHLRPGTREHFMHHLAEDWPEEAERYERLYARGAYLRKDVTGPVQAVVAELRREHGIADRRRTRLLRRWSRTSSSSRSRIVAGG